MLGGCPANAAPTSVDAVLYDASDVLSSIQLDWMRHRLIAWVLSVPKHGNVKIFLLSDPPEGPTKRFDHCNPGSGKDESFWIANPERLRQRWEKTFHGPANIAIDKLPAGVTRRSPLLENIQALGVRAGLGPPHAVGNPDTKIPRRLLLVSDLLQHTEAVSLYQTGCAQPAAFIGSSGWHSVRANLTGLEIDVLLVRRAGTAVCEERALIHWWDTVLQSLGATLSSVEPLPGLAPASVLPEADE